MSPILQENTLVQNQRSHQGDIMMWQTYKYIQSNISYTLWFLRYMYSPDNKLKVKVTIARSKVKSWHIVHGCFTMSVISKRPMASLYFVIIKELFIDFLITGEIQIIYLAISKPYLVSKRLGHFKT